MSKKRNLLYVDDVENLVKRRWTSRWIWPQVEEILMKTGSISGAADVLRVTPKALYNWLEKPSRRLRWQKIRRRWAKERAQAREERKMKEKRDLEGRYWERGPSDETFLRASALLAEGRPDEAIALLDREMA